MIVSEEFTGKKVQDAIDEGLRKFRKTIDDVDVKVLSQGGFLKKARVSISYEAPDVKPKAGLATEVKKEIKQENKIEAKKEIKQEVKLEAKPQVKPEIKPQAKPEIIKENKPQLIKQEPKPQAKQEFKPQERKDGAFEKKKRPLGEKREDRVPPTKEQEQKVSEFLTRLVKEMGIEGEVKTIVNDDLNVTIETTDSAVIGHRGETLDALQYLTSICINNDKTKHVHVALDALSYRQKRRDSLVALAKRMADKVDKSGKRMSLEPMSSGDRRIIHAALSEDDRVVTRSEGFEPNRKILIFPKRKVSEKAE